METPELDNHWKQEAEEEPEAIGFMEIPRGWDTLLVRCRVPARSFHSLPVTLAAEKIKYASLSGTVLKWRRGTVFSISLSTEREEE